jgi:superfamily II DNA or RNA helicase
MKILSKWNNQRQLRKWQKQAVHRFYAVNKTDFLAVGTPGSGKTDFALKIAHDLLTDGKIERVVVVTPTEHLKRQWAEAAARCGIDIDPNWTNANGCEANDYFGAAVTYSQVSFAPDLYDFNCLRPTLVVFDEIHHAGDGLDWGDKLRVAFGNAVYRLALSGTPFRNDGNQIPFVRYEHRRSRADFTYSYGEALADGVCCPIYFPTVEGNVAWIRGNGEQVKCSLLDDLSRQKSAERLRAALDADGEWIAGVLREADNRLTEMRLEGQADAAGLVIAIDQYHARKIAELLKFITNEMPTVAISDEENSSRLIQDFARRGNHRRWIVAVKMVSEGVDIPRLRVGVYATTVLSELFFRQAVGRLIRVISGIDEQSAAFYLPADETLIRHALAIKEERDHFLPEIIRAEKQYAHNTIANFQNLDSIIVSEINITDELNSDLENSDNEAFDFASDKLSGDKIIGGSEPTFPDIFSNGLNQSNSTTGNDQSPHRALRQFIVPLSSEARLHDTVFDGSRFSSDELVQAETIGRELGVTIPSAQVAAIIRRATDSENCSSNIPHNSSMSAAVFPNCNSESCMPIKSERKDKLRKRINQFANKLARLTNSEYDAIHRRWIQEMSGKSNREATEEELESKLTWLQSQISGFYRFSNES